MAILWKVSDMAGASRETSAYGRRPFSDGGLRHVADTMTPLPHFPDSDIFEKGIAYVAGQR